MGKITNKVSALGLAGLMLLSGLAGPSKADTGLSDVKIKGEWFISYVKERAASSQFKIERGYLRFTKRINPWLSGHITMDVHDEGGSQEVRLKYLMAKIKAPDIGILKDSTIEVGLVHTPWLDFEEHINMYRCEGTMFPERNGLFNSGDFGVTYFALLGGKMPSSYQKTVSPYYPGKYGSISVGIYNGGGYHADEKNNNKAVEGRITFRPLPSLIPGLQVSYFGVIGKGNDSTNPDWRVNLLFLSYQSRFATLTSQYYWGKGNFKGTDSYDKRGYSLFSELKLFNLEKKLPLSIFGRYDYFDPNTSKSGDESNRYIVGIAYHFGKPYKEMLVLSYDKVDYKNAADDYTAKLTLKLSF